MKSAYDSESDLKLLKGITPEMRCLYLFHDLQRQHTRELIKIAEEEQRRKIEEGEREAIRAEFMRTWEGRLSTMFDLVGAEVIHIRFDSRTKNAIIDWKLNDLEFNSVIDVSTGRIVEAGYCMSGHDHEHNITSMVKFAEDYDERGVIYYTRTEVNSRW